VLFSFFVEDTQLLQLPECCYITHELQQTDQADHVLYLPVLKHIVRPKYDGVFKLMSFVFAREMGMSESLFARLDSPHATVCLDLQYRMNQAITDVANNLAYNGQLKCGNEEVSSATLQLPAHHVSDIIELYVNKNGHEE
jgi:superfamily I DNA and/or RNA helicase